MTKMSRPLERADDLAMQASGFLAENSVGPLLAIDCEELAVLRTAAFRFSQEVLGTEPLILKARDLADALLEFLSQLRGPDSFEKLLNASSAYEQARPQCPDVSTSGPSMFSRGPE
jgi:hypothetical protein